MSGLHHLFGLTCPACGGPLHLAGLIQLRGHKTRMQAVHSVPCPHCGTAIKARGSRDAQTLRLLAVYGAPALLAGLTMGVLAALALQVLLLPFVFRVVGFETAE